MKSKNAIYYLYHSRIISSPFSQKSSEPQDFLCPFLLLLSLIWGFIILGLGHGLGSHRISRSKEQNKFEKESRLKNTHATFHRYLHHTVVFHKNLLRCRFSFPFPLAPLPVVVDVPPGGAVVVAADQGAEETLLRLGIIVAATLKDTAGKG